MIENIHNIETFITFFIYNLIYKLAVLDAHEVYMGLTF